MAVFLIRHAESVWNAAPKRFQGRADVPLSENGRQQLANYAVLLPLISHVWVSPAQRCLATLDALLRCFEGTPSIHVDKGLWEIDMGWFTGKTVEEVKAVDERHYQSWMDHPEFSRPGEGETVSELQVRVREVVLPLIAVAAEQPDEHILVVTHGGPIRTLLCQSLDLSLAHFHRQEVGNLATFEVGELRKDGGFTIQRLDKLIDETTVLEIL
jgi:broad specificity phosphatase PhoE